MAYKYISSIPKPLLNDFVNSRVIPFVGAGFSKNADIPKGLSMPDWNELGKLAAAEITHYEYENNAVDTLSYYEDLYSRAKLVEFLMKELHFGKIQPGATYKAFCDLFTGTICTTNFDSLLEDSMTLLHRPVSVVATKDRLAIDGRGESKIVKLHGDFNHPDRMVITEHDYDMYLEQNPIFATYIANLFITNTMLLIGYSLDDNDFRSIWQIINSRLGTMAQPAYCIVVNASREKIAKYQRRNIRVINLEGKAKDYKTILHDFFVEVKDYIDHERENTAESIDERINEQLMIPAEDNKLCFISCAMSRIAQLSALLYPLLHGLGITPVRIDDMLMPDDNWIDISSTAIRKAKAAIVDISDSSPNVMYELELIQSEKPKQNIFIICEKGTVIPAALKNHSVLFYTFDVGIEKYEDCFIMALKEWIHNVFYQKTSIPDSNSHNIFADADRLFAKGEYSACIISAYSELEHQLSLHYCNTPSQNGKTLPYFRLGHYLKDNSDNNVPSIKQFMLLRNTIVHERYIASEKEAQEALEFVKKFVTKLINTK